MVSGQPDVSELRLFGAQGIGASRDTRNRAVAPTAGFPRVFGGRGKDWGRRPQAWGLGVGRRPARGSGLVRRSAPLPARGWGGGHRVPRDPRSAAQPGGGTAKFGLPCAEVGAGES